MASRQERILLTISIFLVLPQAARPQEPPAGGPGAGAAAVITNVVPELTDPAMPRITIHGENLGTTPQVFLGEDVARLLPLFVRSATDTVIVADLPVTIGPGSYTLVVQAAAGSANTDMVDVTIGAEAPRGPEGRWPAKEAPGAAQTRQTNTAAAPERLQASGADLKTAKTIYVEQMPEDLHRHIAARLTEKGVYKVLLNKEQADLWMMGTAAAVPRRERREPGQWAEAARILAGEPKPKEEREASMTSSVYIVPRGSEEILWATEATDLSGAIYGNPGPRTQIARVIVKRLQKAIKKK